MKELKEFYIPFVGLKEGIHDYNYQIDNTFFEAFNYREFNNAHIKVLITLIKNSTTLTLSFVSKGSVNVCCDLSNEPYDQDIEGSLELVVKFGAYYDDNDDEILILPHGEHQIHVAQYIYEMIVLSIPAKKIHPGIHDGTLSSDILKRLDALHPKQHKEEDKIDPRWDTLKKLLTDK